MPLLFFKKKKRKAQVVKHFASNPSIPSGHVAVISTGTGQQTTKYEVQHDMYVLTETN